MIPNGIDPDDLQPQDAARAARGCGRVRRAGREARPADRPPRLREGLPARARGDAARDRGGARHPLPRRRLGHPRGRSCKTQASELGLMEHGTFLGWIGDDVLHSLYRIADSAVVPSIYEPFGLVALEAMASGLSLHRRRHRRPARGRPARGGRPALPLPRPRGARRRSRCACSPTTSSGRASSPRPTSTCAASTGPTSPSSTAAVYGSWRGWRPWPGAADERRRAAGAYRRGIGRASCTSGATADTTDAACSRRAPRRVAAVDAGPRR